jgi:hypothetical protein
MCLPPQRQAQERRPPLHCQCCNSCTRRCVAVKDLRLRLRRHRHRHHHRRKQQPAWYLHRRRQFLQTASIMMSIFPHQLYSTRAIENRCCQSHPTACPASRAQRMHGRACAQPSAFTEAKFASRWRSRTTACAALVGRRRRRRSKLASTLTLSDSVALARNLTPRSLTAMASRLGAATRCAALWIGRLARFRTGANCDIYVIVFLHVTHTWTTLFVLLPACYFQPQRRFSRHCLPTSGTHQERFIGALPVCHYEVLAAVVQFWQRTISISTTCRLCASQ